jgi:hypothetical protein
VQNACYTGVSAGPSSHDNIWRSLCYMSATRVTGSTCSVTAAGWVSARVILYLSIYRSQQQHLCMCSRYRLLGPTVSGPRHLSPPVHFQERFQKGDKAMGSISTGISAALSIPLHMRFAIPLSPFSPATTTCVYAAAQPQGKHVEVCNPVQRRRALAPVPLLQLLVCQDSSNQNLRPGAISRAHADKVGPATV